MNRAILLSIAVALLAATPAVADQAIAELGRDSSVAGYGGWKAWSRHDEGTARYALMLRAPDDKVSAAPVPASSKPFDVALGPGPGGDVVAIYRRCATNGCDLRLLHLAEGSTEALPTVSSPHYSEATPAIWRSTVVFTRRIRGCDVPFVTTLTSAPPSRRLLRAKCLQTAAGHASIRGTRILISSVDRSRTDEHGAGVKVSEIRTYSSRTARSSVLLRQSFGEESNLFGQVAQDDRFGYTVRIGTHVENTLVRVPVGGGRAEEVRAFRGLTGAFAKPTPKESLYVEEQGDEPIDCDGAVRVPCRMVLSPVVPFGGVERTVTPALTVEYGPPAQPRRGQPLVFSGRLTRRVVVGTAAARAEPLAGVAVELYHRSRGFPERFEATGLKGVTDPDGAYRIVLPAAGDDPWYTAVAATPEVPTWAGRGTVGSVTTPADAFPALARRIAGDPAPGLLPTR